MKKILTFSFLFTVIATVIAFGQTGNVYWDGGAGTNNWTDNNNWDCDCAPTSASEVRINIAATVNLSGITTTIKRLALEHASASLTIESNVNLTIDGSTSDGIRVNPGTFTNNGTITIQNIGNGVSDNGIDVRTTFNNYGSITISGGTDYPVITYGGTAVFNNKLNSSLTINNSPSFGIRIYSGNASPSTFNNDGTVTINSAPDDAIRLETGIFNNNLNGTIDINTPADLGISILENGDLNNAGLIDVSGAVARYGIELYYNGSETATLDNLSTGTINISSSGQEGLKVGGSTTLNNAGMLSTDDIDNNGSIYNTGTLANSGTLSGDGVLAGNGGTYNGNFTNPVGGNLAPGSSPGCMAFGNDFINNGAIEIDLGDGSACNNYDQITVTGDATINGTIEVSFVGGTAPTTTTFTVLTAAGSLVANPTITWPTGFTGTFSIIPGSPNELQLSYSSLPVELTIFLAKYTEDNVVQLNWRTESETNNEGFDIEHSTDGKSWDNLAFLPGHGTTHEEQSYTYTDERPLPGLNYYRLQQVDFDGAFEYSKVVSVDVERDGSGMSLYPNPATGQVTLALETDYAGEATLNLYDLTGKQITAHTFYLEGNQSLTEVGLESLPAGVYIAEVKAGQKLWRERLVVE